MGKTGVFLLSTFSILPLKTRQGIHKKMLDIVFNADPKKNNYFTYIWGNITRILPKEVYGSEPVKLPFEGRLLKVPADYKQYLQIIYGNYLELPPMEERTRHYTDAIIDFENSYEQYMLV